MIQQLSGLELLAASVTETAESQKIPPGMSHFPVEGSRLLVPHDHTISTAAMLSLPSSFCSFLFSILPFSVGFSGRWSRADRVT